MLVIVIFTEGYWMYDDYYDREIYKIHLQHPNESQEDFKSRIYDIFKLLSPSKFESYESEIFDCEYPEEYVFPG